MCSFSEREKQGSFSRSPQGMGSRRSEKCTRTHPVNWTHGTNGLLIGYALSAVGVLVGMLVGRAPLNRLALFPLIAIPVLIVAVL